MGYTIPAGYSRVTFEYAARSSMGSQIVFGFGAATDPGDAFLDVCEEWWTESLKLRTSAAYRLERIEMRNDVSVLDRTIGETGQLAGDVAPPNTAALVKLTTGLIGRENRGRLYLPGCLLDTEVTDTGTIDSTALASIQGVMDYLVALMVDATTPAVILHSGVGAPTQVTNVQVQSVAATQRRRLRA